MAYISISDLRPAGAELFSDSESYLNELVTDEISEVYGGAWFIPLVLSIARVSVAASRASSYQCAASGSFASGVSAYFTFR